MPFIKSKCGKCGKDAESVKEFHLAGETVHVLKCGHMLRQSELKSSGPEAIVSLDGKTLFPYQCEGIKFAEKSSGRALIADEMGLGKTVQALGVIALHDEMQPAVYIVKSALKIQWQHEILRWVSKDDDTGLAIPQVIERSSDRMLKGLKHYLFSFDILRRFKDGLLAEMFADCGIKTLVIDECQQISNVESERARQVRELSRLVPYVIGLSGTPIKNKASEYFSILNILKPEIFPKYSQFLYNDCDSYVGFNGSVKVGGLRDPKRFAEKTKSFIIRRERKDVMPELPQVTRQFQYHELSAKVEQEYKDTFKQFQDEYFESGDSFTDTSNIMAYLAKMRHITGKSKIGPCVSYVEDFMFSTDRKITIFVHHKDVAQILEYKLIDLVKMLPDEKSPLMFTSDLSVDKRNEVVQSFMNDNGPRILIASTLAAGEGLNLQKCSDCVVMERQWNPANEEQAEGRFIRIGQLADKVTAMYLVAVGTVDEYFAEIVERKRQVVKQTLGSDYVQWDQSSIMKDLAQVLAAKGGKKWGW